MQLRCILLAISVASLLTTSTQAQVHFELATGVSTYKTAENGRWYQEGMPYSLDLRAPMISAGFTGPLYSRGAWGVDWHVNYVNLGHMSSDCTCTPRDDNYDFVAKKKLNLYDVQDARYVGNGNAQGVALTVEPYWMHKSWRFGFEIGPFIHRAAFDEAVYGWQIHPGVTPQDLYVSTPRRFDLGAVLGFSIGRGPLRLSYKRYFMPNRYQKPEYPAIWRGADVIELKYVF